MRNELPILCVNDHFEFLAKNSEYKYVPDLSHNIKQLKWIDKSRSFIADPPFIPAVVNLSRNKLCSPPEKHCMTGSNDSWELKENAPPP